MLGRAELDDQLAGSPWLTPPPDTRDIDQAAVAAVITGRPLLRRAAKLAAASAVVAVCAVATTSITDRATSDPAVASTADRTPHVTRIRGTEPAHQQQPADPAAAPATMTLLPDHAAAPVGDTSSADAAATVTTVTIVEMPAPHGTDADTHAAESTSADGEPPAAEVPADQHDRVDSANGNAANGDQPDVESTPGDETAEPAPEINLGAAPSEVVIIAPATSGTADHVTTTLNRVGVPARAAGAATTTDDIAASLSSETLLPGAVVVVIGDHTATALPGDADPAATVDPDATLRALDTLMSQVPPSAKVLWVMTGDTSSPFNAALRHAARRWPLSLTVADWTAIAARHEGIDDPDAARLPVEKLQARFITNAVLGLPTDTL